MSTMTNFIVEFNAWIKADPARAAKALGTYPSIIQRWIDGTHKPSLEMISKYHDEIKGKAAAPVTAGDARTDEKPNTAPTPPKAVKTRVKPSGDKPAMASGKALKAVASEPAPEPEPEPEDEDGFGGMPPMEPQPVTPEPPVPDEKPIAGISAAIGQAVDWLVKNAARLPWAIVAKLRAVFFTWEGRKLAVLFPCYKLTNAATAWSLTALALDLGKEKAFFDMELGDAMIYHARNKLAHRFVESGREWSLWLDDDIIPPIGRAAWFKYIGRLPEDFPDAIAGQHIVTRLISHGKTIVGGTYFGRQPGGPPMCSEMYRPDFVRDARAMKDGIRSVDWVATGALLVHRQVFLDIQAKFPDLAPDEFRKEWDYFRPTEKGGEDVAFCARAREAGHEVFVDTGLQCLHVGWACYGAHNTNVPL